MKTDSITGRDGYIMGQALYWAVKWSQAQPENLREWSNEQDMIALLKARFPLWGDGRVKVANHMLDEFRKEQAEGKEPGYDWEALFANLAPPDLTLEKYEDEVSPEPEAAAA